MLVAAVRSLVLVGVLLLLVVEVEVEVRPPLHLDRRHPVGVKQLLPQQNPLHLNNRTK